MGMNKKRTILPSLPSTIGIPDDINLLSFVYKSPICEILPELNRSMNSFCICCISSSPDMILMQD